jgi:hypothetical protein
MLHPQGLRVIQELSESLMVVAKNNPFKKRLPRRCPKKGVVLILRNVYPYDQILRRMPYLFPQC